MFVYNALVVTLPRVLIDLWLADRLAERAADGSEDGSSASGGPGCVAIGRLEVKCSPHWDSDCLLNTSAGWSGIVYPYTLHIMCCQQHMSRAKADTHRSPSNTKRLNPGHCVRSIGR